MLHFRDIFPTEMTEEDKKLLVSMSDHDYDGRDAAELFKQVLANRCGLIRIEGDMTGLMLVRKTRDRLGYTLWIEALGGEGLIANWKEFEEKTVELAKLKNCQSISGVVEKSGLLKVYEKMGCKVVAHIFRKVLSDATPTLDS